ncbi:superoxide dismutase, Fe-Mn family [Nematocida parisii]|uniref:Superoxide dismutase n=1 Tax=Nematocida parisii (strain ERTm3) TaxID=935791 RepID=I3EJC1_NEMP3|nr:uncharacterized protein NEPG_02555 [Nematocida parisii ERTm1]EIJ89318.1 hypothetical protein NEQG_00088 [Nematocida parisii ERTm3]KAI5125684.1 superoxide dismutase, Fe-Mn family [Nematocida parisii]EIJ92667.1 hypothetical protein NEPG_02555 [Nematocida parisii ERTm1]KAI5125694.1 superoxide dismutase, Fe-Mn family [Nematocida parisii]KAI5140273.1 superoxide dismutase, Fe-Mn family [Nematocida parisii]|eukprot:XP_013060382.1 hypothetical protein NEPG_02555 [Nematocida parisii ERTm1]
MHINLFRYRESLSSAVQLPRLEYSYADMSDIMSEEMLDIHYSKLHQNYINQYNKIQAQKKMTQLVYTPQTEEEILLLFFLGGHLNHSLFWQSFHPSSSKHTPSKRLSTLLSNSFSEGLLNSILNVVTSNKIRGSGWIWLAYNENTELLYLDITMNQDMLSVPVLLNIDMWEHAYFIQYKVDKIDYINKLYSIINWENASNRLDKILDGDE